MIKTIYYWNNNILLWAFVFSSCSKYSKRKLHHSSQRCWWWILRLGALAVQLKDNENEFLTLKMKLQHPFEEQVFLSDKLKDFLGFDNARKSVCYGLEEEIGSEVIRSELFINDKHCSIRTKLLLVSQIRLNAEHINVFWYDTCIMSEGRNDLQTICLLILKSND